MSARSRSKVRGPPGQTGFHRRDVGAAPGLCQATRSVKRPKCSRRRDRRRQIRASSRQMASFPDARGTFLSSIRFRRWMPRCFFSGAGCTCSPPRKKVRAVLAARQEKRCGLYLQPAKKKGAGCTCSPPRKKVRAVLAARQEKRCGLYLQPAKKKGAGCTCSPPRKKGRAVLPARQEKRGGLYFQPAKKKGAGCTSSPPRKK